MPLGRQSLSVLLIFALFTGFARISSAQSLGCDPPPTPTKPTTNTYFGTTLSDPYQWLENLNDPAVKGWFKSQADYTNLVMSKIPGRDKLYARLHELAGGQTFLSGVCLCGKYVFYRKIRPKENLAKIYVRVGLHGTEKLLVDPEALSKKSTVHYAVDFFQPSLTGKYVAYGISPGGSEASVIQIVNVESGKLLPEKIDRAELANIRWLPGDKSFLYNRLRKLSPGEDQADKYMDSSEFLHTLGTDPDKSDRLILARGVNPQIKLIRQTDSPYIIYLSGCPEWIFAMNERGVQNEVALWIAPFKDIYLNPSKIPWKRICDFNDDVTAFDAFGDKLYLVSHKNAPHFDVLCENAADPSFAKAKCVIPNSQTVITGINAAKDALYIEGMNAGLGRLMRLPYKTSIAENIPLAIPDGVEPLVSTSPEYEGALYEIESGLHPPCWFDYNPKFKSTVDTRLQPPSLVDFSDVAEKQVMVTGQDGAQVPLTILYPKSMELDGSHPADIEGYGSYGVVDDVYYNPCLIAIIERGMVIAVAHVRGGGELGEEWYEAGKKLNKHNTWEDFNSCAEYLIKNGYTSPAKLAGEGTSAGGITIGRAVTTRPDLYAAALFRVPAVNTVRDELTPNGPNNIPEFGTATTPDGFNGLYAMDTYQHITSGTKYPAVMLVTGFNDPRVSSWEPGKAAAKLQAAEAALPEADRKPILLRVDYDAGHGMGSSLTQEERDAADEWAFLLWQFGDPDFQPK